MTKDHYRPNLMPSNWQMRKLFGFADFFWTCAKNSVYSPSNSIIQKMGCFTLERPFNSGNSTTHVHSTMSPPNFSTNSMPTCVSIVLISSYQQPMCHPWQSNHQQAKHVGPCSQHLHAFPQYPHRIPFDRRPWWFCRAICLVCESMPNWPWVPRQEEHQEWIHGFQNYGKK